MATTVEHGQLAQVDSSGNVTVLYPKTFTSDIYVGNTSKTLSSLLGSTDISSVGDGTITGAISSLNNDIPTYLSVVDGKINVTYTTS